MLLPIQKKSSTTPDRDSCCWLLHRATSFCLSLSPSEEKAPLAGGPGLSPVAAAAVERIRAEDTGPMGKKLFFLDVFIKNNWDYKLPPKSQGDVPSENSFEDKRSFE